MLEWSDINKNFYSGLDRVHTSDFCRNDTAATPQRCRSAVKRTTEASRAVHTSDLRQRRGSGVVECRRVSLTAARDCFTAAVPPGVVATHAAGRDEAVPVARWRSTHERQLSRPLSCHQPTVFGFKCVYLLE